jgi:hypothetical protein
VRAQQDLAARGLDEAQVDAGGPFDVEQRDEDRSGAGERGGDGRDVDLVERAGHDVLAGARVAIDLVGEHDRLERGHIAEPS